MNRSRWLVLAVVFIARASMGYQFQVIGSVGPFLVALLAIDFAILGALIGVYKLPGVLLAIPSGLLGNRFGEKSILIVGMVLMAAGGFVTAWSDTAEVVFLGRIISGSGAVMFNVLSAKMIADWFAEKELTFAFALYVNSWPFGIALGLATQAALAQWFSVSGMLAASAALCSLAVVLLAFGSRDKGRQGIEGRCVGPMSRMLGDITMREFVLVSVAAMIWLLFNANLIIVVSFAPSYLAAMGYDVAAAGRLTSLSTWFGIAAIPLGGYLVQRGMSASRFMGLAFLAGSAATFAIVWLGNPLIAFLAFGVCAWAPAGPIFALPVSVLCQENRAVGMGIFLSYYYLGLGFFSPLAGYLRDLTSDPATPIVFAGCLLFGALVMLIIFNRLKSNIVEPGRVKAALGQHRHVRTVQAD